MATRCTATTAAGAACKAWAVKDTNPPRCAAHGGTKARPGAPKGNANAVTHGFYRAIDATTVGLEETADESSSLDKVIHQLQTRLDDLDRYIDTCSSDDPDAIIKLIALHSQAGTRLARLLERRQAIDDKSDEGDALMRAINAALDKANEFLDIDV